MALLAIPHPQATGELWAIGNVDEPDTWFYPGQALVARRKSVRQLLERWIAQENRLPFDTKEGTVYARGDDDLNLLGMQKLMLDPPADDPNAQPGDDDGTMFANYDEEETQYGDQYGPVAKFYRLAARTFTAQQYVMTDEQERLDRELIGQLNAANEEQALTINQIGKVLITFLSLLEAFVSTTAVAQWKELGELLNSIVSTLERMVPGLGTYVSWQRFSLALKGREEVSAGRILELQVERTQAYKLASWAGEWEFLDKRNFSSFDLKGGGECFFLSAGFIHAKTHDERIQYYPTAQPAGTNFIAAHKIRVKVIEAMRDEKDYEFYCEQVLTSLTGDAFGDFVINDCNEELFGEQTLMNSAATIEGKVGFRARYAKYDDETLAEAKVRRRKVYNAYLQVMSRSKWSHVLQFNGDDTFRTRVKTLIQRQAGPVGITNDAIMRQAVSTLLIETTPTPFATEPIVNAAAYALRMRINTYVQNQDINTNDFERVASHGRLTFSPWAAIVHKPLRRHYMPIVKASAGAGPNNEPAGKPPRMPDKEIPSEELPLVTLREGEPEPEEQLLREKLEEQAARAAEREAKAQEQETRRDQALRTYLMERSAFEEAEAELARRKAVAEHASARRQANAAAARLAEKKAQKERDDMKRRADSAQRSLTEKAADEKRMREQLAELDEIYRGYATRLAAEQVEKMRRQAEAASQRVNPDEAAARAADNMKDTTNQQLLDSMQRASARRAAEKAAKRQRKQKAGPSTDPPADAPPSPPPPRNDPDAQATRAKARNLCSENREGLTSREKALVDNVCIRDQQRLGPDDPV
jgi:hypothetical protein